MPARIPSPKQPAIHLDGKESSEFLQSIHRMAEATNAMAEIYGLHVAPSLREISAEQRNLRAEYEADRSLNVKRDSDHAKLSERVARLETRISNRPGSLVLLSTVIAILAGASASVLSWILRIYHVFE